MVENLTVNCLEASGIVSDEDVVTTYYGTTRKLYYSTYMGGKWNDYSTDHSMTYDEFDQLTHNDLMLNNKKSRLYKEFHPIPSYIRGIPEIGIYEHFSHLEKYYHLVFDVDEVKDEVEYIKAMDYFNKLSEHLGDYSIAEYTNNKELADTYEIPYIEGTKKYYSAHVCYYTKKIHVDLLDELMRVETVDGNQRFINDGLEYQDANLWNKFHKSGHMILRVGVSNKIHQGERNKKTHRPGEWHMERTSTIVTDRNKKRLPNSANLVTMREEEIEVLDSITKADLIACGITFVDNQDSTSNSKHKYKAISKAALDRIELNENYVRLTYEQLEELLKDVVPQDEEARIEFELGQYVSSLLAGNASHIFTDPQRLADLLTEWYNSRGDHSNYNTCAGYVSTYYNKEPVPNNYWFSKLCDKIPNAERRKYWLDTYGRELINKDLTMNAYTPDDQLTIESVMCKTYDVKQWVEETKGKDGIVNREIKYKLTGLYDLINDLKRCVGFVNGTWYIKTRNNTMRPNLYVTMRKEDLITNYIVRPFGTSVDITLSGLIIRYVNYFVYTDVVFMSPEDMEGLPKTDNQGNVIRRLNLFYGFLAQDVPNEECATMVNAIVANLCEEDEERESIISKISWVLRHMTRSGTIEVFTGMGGTGKGVLYDIIYSFAKPYMNKVRDVENVVGNQNSQLEGSLYVFMNELPMCTENRVDMWNSFKDMVDGAQILIADKYIRRHLTPNVCNYFIFSNNAYPIPLRAEDRRTNIHRTNRPYAEKDPMIAKLYAMLTDQKYVNGFYSYFYHYLDDKEYDPRHIIKNEARSSVIESTTTRYERYVKDTPEVYEQLKLGIREPRKTIHKLLSEHPPDGMPLNSKSMSQWLGQIRQMLVMETENKVRKYKLADRYIDELKPTVEDLMSDDVLKE